MRPFVLAALMMAGLALAGLVLLTASQDGEIAARRLPHAAR
jgi:hypothetical protein